MREAGCLHVAPGGLGRWASRDKTRLPATKEIGHAAIGDSCLRNKNFGIQNAGANRCCCCHGAPSGVHRLCSVSF
ncbi:hypothetical protein VTK73DRAFT_6101 [Phialemonium thermophilum]|uniref:Uncharacterized protein n=1 Tax=Phialemonium thermophilum TaxID=223376 RepID=A0ABR3V061_9PEZI